MTPDDVGVAGGDNDSLRYQDPENTVITEILGGAECKLMYVEVWDGLYAPIGARKPDGDGPHPMILLASGNGGGGMAWIRDACSNRGHIMDRLVDAGYACAWLRYRTEVELGYHNGGPLVRDMRQGRELFNRSPLEYEDEIAIIEQIKTLPFVDPDRVGLIGMSHGGEMVLKIASEYHGAAVAIAAEPAAHEFLALTPDETAFVNEETRLRNIESMIMTDVAKVRDRIDHAVATERISGIDTPILVMGRETDELQGIFRLSFELMKEAGKEVEWVSYDHPMHGYIYPIRGDDGAYLVDETQRDAIDRVVGYLDRYLRR
jgi:acetyl esterase/lipase